MIRRRLRALLTLQVAAPIIGYVLTAVLVVSVVEAFVARQEAIDTRNRTAAAAARRIDLLNVEITRLHNRLASDARERGRLEEAIRLLAMQVRRLGGVPVEAEPPPAVSPTSFRSPHPAPRPQTSPTHHPAPSPSPTRHPSPSPAPSPTRTCVLIVCLRG